MSEKIIFLTKKMEEKRFTTILSCYQNELSSPKIITMKGYLPLLLVAAFVITGCSNIIEKQFDTYKDAMEELDDVKKFPALMKEVLKTSSRIAEISSTSTEKKIEKMKKEYGAEYETILDSLEKVREEYFMNADRIFKKFTFNFVEQRTLIYRTAADWYCKAECMEELEALKSTIKRYSALSFVESQRAFDPPAKIREEYEEAKELAESCFDVAKKRILEEEEEKNNE